MGKNIIAFSGTHGSGKSTAAYILASQMKMSGYSVVVLDELARECPLPINKESDALTQYWILSAQIKKEIKLMSKYDYVIADRSIFDTISYAVTLNLINIDHDDILSSYVKNYYHSIFLLDPDGFDYQFDDGIRDLDSVFRYDIYVTLRKLYDKFNIKYKLLHNKEALDEVINRLTKQKRI